MLTSGRPARTMVAMSHLIAPSFIHPFRVFSYAETSSTATRFCLSCRQLLLPRHTTTRTRSCSFAARFASAKATPRSARSSGITFSVPDSPDLGLVQSLKIPETRSLACVEYPNAAIRMLSFEPLLYPQIGCRRLPKTKDFGMLAPFYHLRIHPRPLIAARMYWKA
jgi:hypothetical protein